VVFSMGFLKLCIQRAYSGAKNGKAQAVLSTSYWHQPPFLMRIAKPVVFSSFKNQLRSAKRVWAMHYDRALALGLKKRIVKLEVSEIRHHQMSNAKSGHATLGHRYSTARVSKRLTNETAACLRARYCTNLTWFDLDARRCLALDTSV
jgi:hypothetical protein